MALVHNDRVKETSTTPGTGTYNLAGAVAGFQSFVAGVGTGNTCYYAATDGTDWEVGLGTVTDATPDTLARTTILQSSNADAAVSWAAGIRTIFCTIPASKFRAIGQAVLAADLPAASDTAQGAVELATKTETLTGTDATRAITPDGLLALWAKGTNVASAGTISLGEGSFFHITGTTTITDIDFATAVDGRRAWLIFDGILTLTHHATTLVCPDGISIITAAGDAVEIVQDSSDNIKVLTHTKVGGWAATTPTPSAETNNQTTGWNYTSSLHILKRGRLVIASGSVTATNVGSPAAAGFMVVPLPYTAAAAATGNAQEVQNTAAVGFARVLSGNASIDMKRNDGVTFWANTNVVSFTVVYEATI